MSSRLCCNSLLLSSVWETKKALEVAFLKSTTNPNILKTLLKGGAYGPSAHRSDQSTQKKHFRRPVGVGLLSELPPLKDFAIEGTC